jgi:hypothetical protein
MALANYSRVRLLTDRHQDEGVTIGAVGYIIEVYNDSAYEVEFSDDQGTTLAQLVLQPDEIELCEEDPHMSQ